MSDQEVKFPKAAQELQTLLASTPEKLDQWLQAFAVRAVRRFASFIPSDWTNEEILSDMCDSDTILSDYQEETRQREEEARAQAEYEEQDETSDH